LRAIRRHTPGAEALVVGVVERPKAEALGYLEAKAKATVNATATATATVNATATANANATATATAKAKCGGLSTAQLTV